MHKAIDLGKKWDEGPTEPIGISELKNRVHYPDLYISDTDETRLLELPDEGEATIKFRVVHRTHTERQRDGKKERRCSITLEIMKIDPFDNPKAAKKNNNGDELRKSFTDYFKDK